MYPDVMAASESLALSGTCVQGKDESSSTDCNNWLLNQRCQQTAASTPDTATAVATSGMGKHCWCQQCAFPRGGGK